MYRSPEAAESDVDCTNYYLALLSMTCVDMGKYPLDVPSYYHIAFGTIYVDAQRKTSMHS